MKFEVENRWTGKVHFVADIECDDNATIGVKIGLSVKWAVLNRADLRGANLRGANLYGALGLYNACPVEGCFVGWKKASSFIVKLLIVLMDCKRFQCIF